MVNESFYLFKKHLLKNNYEALVENLESSFINQLINEDFHETALHYACSAGSICIIELLIQNNCNINIKGFYNWSPLHYAVNRGSEAVVNLLLYHNCDINAEDVNNKTALHHACDRGNFNITKILIENKCNLQFKDNNKWTAMHYACKFGSVDIVELLMEHDCEMDETTKDGHTPLDIAIFYNHNELVNFIEKEKITIKIRRSILKDDDETFKEVYTFDFLKDMDVKSGQSWLELVLNSKANKIMKFILNRPIDEKEVKFMEDNVENISKSINIKLWEEICLYKCIRDCHERGFILMCHADVINREMKIVDEYSNFLEMAIVIGKSLFFVCEVTKKSDLDVEGWAKVEEIALERGDYQIQAHIKERLDLLKCRKENNLSLPYTAVNDNDPDMLKYLLEKDISGSNDEELLSDSIILAMELCHENCLTVFDRLIDSNKLTKCLQNAVVAAISKRRISKYLIDRVPNINEVEFFGHIALHCAVMQGSEKLCDQLMQRGADCFRYGKLISLHLKKKNTNQYKKFKNFEEHYTEKKAFNDPLDISKKENSLTLCIKINKTIYKCFHKELDESKANCSDSNGNSLLHLSAKLLNIKLCRLLIRAGGNVNSKNILGNTPLTELLSRLDKEKFHDNCDKIIEIAKLFVKSGYDLYKSSDEVFSIFQIASRFNCEKLLIGLLPEKKDQLFEIDAHLFKIALIMNFPGFFKALLDFFPKEILKYFITTEMIKESLRLNWTTLLKPLVLCANDDIVQPVLEICLYHLAKWHDKESFEYLLDIPIKNQKLFEDGETLFTKLLREGKLYFCRKILQNKVNKKKYLNLKNKNHQTPFQVAIETESKEMMENLLYKTKNLDNEDIEGRTSLMQLMEKISNNNSSNRYLKEALISLIMVGANMFHITSNGKKVIDFCSSLKLKNKMKKILRNHRKNISNVFENKKIVVEEKITNGASTIKIEECLMM